MKCTVQGRTAYAYTGGRPFNATRPAVVFVHGALHDHSCWNLLARWCAHHGYTVLAVDLPGHGGSEGPPLADVETLAGWLLDLLDAVQLPAATLVGHSMGSLIALEAAGRAPARATRLVMMGTAYPMRVSESLLATARDDPARAIDLVTSWSYASIAAKPSFPGPGMWLHGSCRALMHRMQQGCTTLNLFHHEFSICDRYRGGEAAAARVTCPVDFVLGAADQMTWPKAAKALADTLQARVHTVPAGHNLMSEAPQATLAALRAALARDRPAARPPSTPLPA